VRDDAGVLVNSDTTAYQNFLLKKKAIESKQHEVDKMKQQIVSINNNIDEINKTMNSILTLLQGNK